jgi:hypothetical protein
MIAEASAMRAVKKGERLYLGLQKEMAWDPDLPFNCFHAAKVGGNPNLWKEQKKIDSSV